MSYKVGMRNEMYRSVSGERGEVSPARRGGEVSPTRRGGKASLMWRKAKHRRRKEKHCRSEEGKALPAIWRPISVWVSV